jgi:hypothetical protein
MVLRFLLEFWVNRRLQHVQIQVAHRCPTVDQVGL